MFLFSFIDLNPYKHRPIDRKKENIIFILIQELIMCMAAFVSLQFVLPALNKTVHILSQTLYLMI